VTTSSTRPGTYRADDGSKVEFSDALQAWAPLAQADLIATAGTYHAVITYKELSAQVQEASGIQTRMLLTNWIGKLLEEVARRAEAAGEPPLTSLCVRQDGTIRSGYAVAADAGNAGDDLEVYAAGHRLLCYRKYAADMPANGGRAALTTAESDRRRKKALADPAPRPICPTCFTELPSAGNCWHCD
jgi:hypothetical protein